MCVDIGVPYITVSRRTAAARCDLISYGYIIAAFAFIVSRVE